MGKLEEDTMKPITPEELAAKLDCEIQIWFTPRLEDPDDSCKRIPNPKPWSCRKVDYSDSRGEGATLNEACAALVASMLDGARKWRDSSAAETRRSAEHLEKLINLLGGENAPRTM